MNRTRKVLVAVLALGLVGALGLAVDGYVTSALLVFALVALGAAGMLFAAGRVKS
jgi:hypothetical protein